MTTRTISLPSSAKCLFIFGSVRQLTSGDCFVLNSCFVYICASFRFFFPRDLRVSQCLFWNCTICFFPLELLAQQVLIIFGRKTGTPCPDISGSGTQIGSCQRKVGACIARPAYGAGPVVTGVHHLAGLSAWSVVRERWRSTYFFGRSWRRTPSLM